MGPGEYMMTIGDYLLARLAEIGVRHMFGVPGDFNLWFLERTLGNRQIEFVGCCNELNAAYAADGCARLAGASALAVTYGVGDLASLSAVAGAYAERVPVVCISGTPPLDAMRKRALLHHSLADGNFENVLACYREFTVAQARIEPLHARDEIDRVLRTCVLEKRPVYLQLPSDVGGIEVPAITAPLDLNPPPSDPRLLAQAVAWIGERLSKAQRPAVLVDADAGRFGLTELIVKLAETNSIPMASLVTAKGMIPDTHPLMMGIYRGAGTPVATKEAIEESDCLFCIGTRFTDVSSGWFSHSLRETAIIDIQPFSVQFAGRSLGAVQSKELLIELLSLPSRKTEARSVPTESRRIPQASPGTSPGGDKPLTQEALWQRVRICLRPGDVVIADTGTSYFAGVNLPLPENVAFIGQPIWGSIGYALPALLGACVAAPERRHLLFIGDGAFQMTVQELSTILRQGLNPIIFLLNNDGYTIERLIYGVNSTYNDIASWSYRQLPKIFDPATLATGRLVATEGELDVALDEAQDPSRLHLIEVVLPRMDAPEQLVRVGKLVSDLNFPYIQDQGQNR